MVFERLPTAEPIGSLIEALNRLPGVGPKTAARLAYHLLRAPLEEAQGLAEAILAVKERVVLCSRCQNVTEQDPCRICADLQRDAATICVVDEPLDVLALERARYRGHYHVLHGVISPMNGIGPDELKVRELLARLGDGGPVTEVILALSSTLEGEATVLYLQKLVAPLGLRVTRLARGLPAGGDLEYADDVTLVRALEGRQDVGDAG